MSRKAWGSATAVLVAASLCISARGDDNDTYNSVKELEAKRKQRVMATQRIWWERLIPGRLEEKRKLAEGKPEPAKEPEREKEAAKPRTVETASLMQQEMQKYLRREDVCRRLREIAEETNDPQLARQADMLESRAWAAYEEKVATARLPKMHTQPDQAEAKLLAESKKSDAPARAEAADRVRTIRGDGKE